MTNFKQIRRAAVRGCLSTSIAAVLFTGGAGIASADPGPVTTAPSLQLGVFEDGGLQLLPSLPVVTLPTPVATPEAPRVNVPVLGGGTVFPVGGGYTPPVDPNDRDGDGVSNAIERRNGTDPDNTRDRPVDTDGDGTLDVTELEVGTDPLDARSRPGDRDGDGISDTNDDDRDGDGVPNDIEVRAGTDPNDARSKPADSDGDGTNDAQDFDSDSDGDGVFDSSEVRAGTDPGDARSVPGDLDGDGKRDDRDSDMDGDGISNDQERATGHDPRNARDTPPDADGDGVPDARDGSDTDGDGWTDWHEHRMGTDPRDASKHPAGSRPWPHGGNGGTWRPPSDASFNPLTFGLEVSVSVPGLDAPVVETPEIEAPPVYQVPSTFPSTGAVGGGIVYEPVEQPVVVAPAPTPEPASVFQTPWTLGLGGDAAAAYELGFGGLFLGLY